MKASEFCTLVIGQKIHNQSKYLPSVCEITAVFVDKHDGHTVLAKPIYGHALSQYLITSPQCDEWEVCVEQSRTFDGHHKGWAQSVEERLTEANRCIFQHTEQIHRLESALKNHGHTLR